MDRAVGRFPYSVLPGGNLVQEDHPYIGISRNFGRQFRQRRLLLVLRD
ncbi:MAG TPA: hypothetical protein VH302_08115 [Bryobacteraceae bacterium]|nr:hypothetical protein [Bryobacteraceae bacterium]